VPKVTPTPGAAWNADRQKWFARISLNSERKHLGYFDTAEEASAAYLEAKGEKVRARALRQTHAAPTVPAAPLPQSLLEVLFVKTFLDLFGFDPECEIFAELALLACSVARDENVQPWVVSEVLNVEAFDSFDGDIIARHIVVRRVRLLKERGLVERVSAVVDRALKTGDKVSFETAVAELSAADFV